jgi:hypothetical protein
MPKATYSRSTGDQHYLIKEKNMLNELQPDVRKLLDLARKMENFDATLAAARAAGKPIDPAPAAREERKRMELESMQLRAKWAI